MNVDININIVVSGEVIHRVVVDPNQKLIETLTGDADKINAAADQAGKTAETLDKAAPAPPNLL